MYRHRHRAVLVAYAYEQFCVGRASTASSTAHYRVPLGRAICDLDHDPAILQLPRLVPLR